jgi:hypothetical protein
LGCDASDGIGRSTWRVSDDDLDHTAGIVVGVS